MIVAQLKLRHIALVMVVGEFESRCLKVIISMCSPLVRYVSLGFWLLEHLESCIPATAEVNHNARLQNYIHCFALKFNPWL